VGRRPDLQKEIQDAEKLETGWHSRWEHQEACLKVLPAEDGALPHRQYLHCAKVRPTPQYCGAGALVSHQTQSSLARNISLVPRQYYYSLR